MIEWKVFVSRHSGEIGIGRPLYFRYEERKLDNLDGYSIYMSDEDPVAWVISLDGYDAHFVNARRVNKQLKCLGDL